MLSKNSSNKFLKFYVNIKMSKNTSFRIISDQIMPKKTCKYLRESYKTMRVKFTNRMKNYGDSNELNPWMSISEITNSFKCLVVVLLIKKYIPKTT